MWKHFWRNSELTRVFYSYCIVIVLGGVLYFLLWQENKRRSRLGDISEEERDKAAFLDLTDKQNRYFHYVF